MLAPLLVAGAMFTLAGGYVHAREWFDTYRHLPSAVPGSFVVREGFLVNMAMSAIAAVALLVAAAKSSRWTPLVVTGTLLFQVSSLAVLIASRTGSVLGWSESDWTRGATQSRAVEIGAIAVFAAVLLTYALRRVAVVATTRQPVLR